MKPCTKCNKAKPLTDFTTRRASKDGLSPVCKGCAGEFMVGWRAKNPTYHVKLYGITDEIYAAMLKNQNGLCSVCRKPESARRRNGEPKKLAVDHDHETKKVRGLLCQRCNQALGNIKENFDAALNLARYIQEHKGVI